MSTNTYDPTDPATYPEPMPMDADLPSPPFARLSDPEPPPRLVPARPRADVSRELRANTAAVKVTFTWLGITRSVSKHHKEEMARAVNADPKAMSANKKILDSKCPAFKALTTIKGEIKRYWEDNSLPFPEDSVRLIRRDKIEAFQAEMGRLLIALNTAVGELEDQYQDLKESARVDLGNLFNESDYLPSLQGAFGMTWEFPNVEPPSYLMQIHPEVYEAQRARIEAKFNEAVELAEEAFVEEFEGLVTHLCDQLAGKTDGKPQVITNASVNNLRDFFGRFKELNVRSNPELDALVDMAREAVNGTTKDKLKSSGSLRQTIVAKLGEVTAKLETMTIDRPRRRIIRSAAPTTDSE